MVQNLEVVLLDQAEVLGHKHTFQAAQTLAPMVVIMVEQVVARQRHSLAPRR
jgi:hypothetical protein